MFDKKHYLYLEDLQTIAQRVVLEQFRGKSFFITGATGLIGVCLIDTLMLGNQNGLDITVYAVGRDRNKAMSRLGEYYEDDHFHFIEQDVRHPLPESLSVDYIVPLASNTHPLAYSQFPIETIEINVKGVENALNKAVECGATVLYPSTVEVYGNARDEDVFTEDYTGQLNLNTARACYTESKRVSEALCQSYIAEKKAKVKIVRLSRVFGPTMLMSDSKASSQFIIKALNNEDIVLKSKGNQLFSYTYVADVVGAILHVLLHGENGVAYNIANDNCNVRLKEFAEKCAKWAGKQVVYDLPSEVEQRGFSVAMKAVLCTERLKQIGYEARYSFNDAIIRTLEILHCSNKR